MTHARRTLLLALLLIPYVASSVRSTVGGVFRGGAFDPFVPAARALEQRIGDGRFADALPLALELDRAYPRQSQIALWLARVHHGLNDARQEAAAWERYVETSPAPAEACPSLAEAYAHAGQPVESLRAYERCVQFGPDNPAAFIDLGEAYARVDHIQDARAAFERAAELDPENPEVLHRLHAIRDDAP